MHLIAPVRMFFSLYKHTSCRQELDMVLPAFFFYFFFFFLHLMEENYILLKHIIEDLFLWRFKKAEDFY